MRLSFVLAASVMLIGCSPNAESILHVSIDEYAHSRKCWSDNKKNLASFAIFEDANGGYIPLFLSFKCALTEDGSNGAQSKIENINAFRVRESQTNLRDFGFDHGKLYDNDSVELAIPSGGSKVYFVVANYSNDRGEAEIGHFKSVVDTGVDFEGFLQLSDREVYELGSRFRSMSR